jgi:hypothetical protein
MVVLALGIVALWWFSINLAQHGRPRRVASAPTTTTTERCSGPRYFDPQCTTAQRIAGMQRLLQGGGATRAEAACLGPTVERDFRTYSGGYPSPAVQTAFKRCLGPASRFDFDRLATYMNKELFGS